MKPASVLVRLFKLTILLATISLSSAAMAAVEAPYVELEFLTGDERVTLTTGALSTLQLEGTATSIFTDATSFF